MSVYRKFERNDILHSVIYANPRVTLASGTHGWSGNVGVSGSISLYSGIRSRIQSGVTIYPLDELDTHSIDKVLHVSGSYPSTGSVSFVKVRRVPADRTQENGENWYERHFATIELLYDQYSRFNENYFTGSYDNCCLYLGSSVVYPAARVEYATDLSNVSGSMTAEMFVKLIEMSGSNTYTLASQAQRWSFSVIGDGRLAFSTSNENVTSILKISSGIWHHIAFTFDARNVKLYVDGALDVQALLTSSVLPSPSTGTFSGLVIGSAYTNLIISGSGSWLPTRGLKGYVAESRIWRRALTAAEISGHAMTRVIDSGSADLVHYAKMNDGPLGMDHGFAVGSGSADRSRSLVHGIFRDVDATLSRSPIWQPFDNFSIITEKRKVPKGANFFKVLHIPSLYYGRQIATGSLRLVCNSYDGKGISRVLVDDGRGSLYLSGSMTNGILRMNSASLDETPGSRWHKLGNVFYSEGLVVITDPSLFDFGESNKDWGGSSDLLSIEFKGTNRIPTKTFVCRLDPGEGNASRNPTFSRREDHGDGRAVNDRLTLTGDRTTWISAIGIYNEERRLVAVAKLASPIRKREKDRIAIRLRMDF